MVSTEEKKGIQKEVKIDRKANLKSLKSHRFYWVSRIAQDIFFSVSSVFDCFESSNGHYGTCHCD